MNETDIAVCRRLRKEMFLIAKKCGTTHLASGYSCLDILYTLYMKGIVKITSDEPYAADRDRLILSKGHAALALYVILAEMGFFPLSRLYSFMQADNGIGGEPLIGELNGIEASTGSLGHGLSVGVGMAIAQKLNGSSAKTYVILGDGEIEEGSVWEAAASASAFRLDNITAVLDKNELQKMETVKNTIGNAAWEEKWRSFGWDVVNVADGNDTGQLETAFRLPEAIDRPRIIICNTVKGKGVSVMENSVKWHFKLPEKAKELKCIADELGISEGEMQIC